MRKNKLIPLFLIVLCCLILSGCRIRTTGSGSAPGQSREEPGAPQQASGAGISAGGEPAQEEKPGELEKSEEAGERTKENPEASRKEYDENAPAEIVPGTERMIHGEGEGEGAFAPGEDAAKAVTKLNDSAGETATRTVAADEAEQTGVSEDGEEAESARKYFTVLLQDRMGSLFECQRLNVYWETPEDHVTVFKTSAEHSLILNAGAYDVSVRLLEENLRVDDGWIGRKNPGVIVKTVRSSVLGSGVNSTGAAQRIYAELLAREGWSAIDAVRNGRVILLSEELLTAPNLQVAAMLAIAKTANPAQMADVHLSQALEMLMEEETGGVPVGIYYYTGQGGFQ